MIKKKDLIEKRNILNEIRCNNMHLQELRFFTIYLSKINAREPEKTRKVRFPLSDFLKIMEIDKVNLLAIKQTTNDLLCKVVNVPTPTGGYQAFQLFKECEVDKNKNDDDWYIEIDAHDKALPLMFDFKRDYFTYELWNALRLGSSNQLRMYEILKQYEYKGERIVSVDELREMLFIGKKEYPLFHDFKRRVIDSCQIALAEDTDISFDYELIKKAKGKVTHIRFIIKKNTNYVDQITLGEFIDMKDDCITIDGREIVQDEIKPQEPNIDTSFFSEAFNNEFTEQEVSLLYKMAVPLIKYDGVADFNLKMYDYFDLKYRELNVKKGIKKKFNYLKKLIDLDLT